MARVYLDSSVVYLVRGAGESVLSPDLGPAVELLQSAGHEVFLVAGPNPPETEVALSWLPQVGEPTPGLSSAEAAWLIVGDRVDCGARIGGLRTVLVGGGPATRPGSGRCDTEVADLHAAVMAVVEGDTIA